MKKKFVSTNIEFAKVIPKDLVLCRQHNDIFFIAYKTLVEEGNWKIEFIKAKTTKNFYILYDWCF